MARDHWSDARIGDLGKGCSGCSSSPGLEGILTVHTSRYLRGTTGILLTARARMRTPRRLTHLKVLDFTNQCNKHAADKLGFDPPIADSTASYFCTGGTTGIPKIAVRTH